MSIEPHASTVPTPGPAFAPPPTRPSPLQRTPAPTTEEAAPFAGNGAAGTDRPLPRDGFLRELHREKRRADRSRLPLSLALYRLAVPAPDDAARLAALLRQAKRETDILGLLGEDLVGVLFPDTGPEGLRQFVRKTEAAIADLGASTLTATYPDYLFENLEDGLQALQRLHPELDREDEIAVRPVYRLKRPLDLLGALLALIVLSPVMLAAALAVRLSSPGSVIFRQRRLGRGGRPFEFYKFRSMTCDCDDTIHRAFVEQLIKHGNGDAGGGEGTLYKLRADPRITPVGRILRKTSIDELPQLFNVLIGDMSLVGPRPPLPYEAASYQSWHLRRVLEVRPGLTGLWQVEGRSKVSFDDMVRMDLRYIGRCSLGLDLKILLKTIGVVLRCDATA